MEDREFWQLIDESKQESDGDSERLCQILADHLSQKDEEEIIDYQKRFDELYTKSYTSDLWAAAYIVNGGCSDDEFDYFRAWLIAQGKKAFDDAVKDPQTLINIVDEANEEVGLEAFLYVGIEAYKHKTGREEDFYEKFQSLDYPEIQLDWAEDEEVLKQKFPFLCKKFW